MKYIEPNQKIILDACCGGRTFWFNKKHPNAIYIDNRIRPKGFVKQRPNFEVKPDELGDFTKLQFPDKCFKLVVWDPPHLIRKTPELGWPTQKYGSFPKQTWKQDLTLGFQECWRVLEDYGVLIFKWSSGEKRLADILDLFSEQPLFGHTTNRGTTHWLCFMKIPKAIKQAEAPDTLL